MNPWNPFWISSDDYEISIFYSSSLNYITESFKKSIPETLNYQTRTGGTLLTIAVQDGKYDILKLLLFMGADPNVQNWYGETSLEIASKHVGQEIVESVNILLENGANPNIQDNNGSTALIKGIENNHLEIAKLLLENGADPNIQDLEGDNALLIAIKNGNIRGIELLLSYGADDFDRGSSFASTEEIKELIEAYRAGYELQKGQEHWDTYVNIPRNEKK